MRSESLQESLSALMDDQADELEVRRVLQACEQDQALRDTWARYQLARAVMHKEPWQGQVDLSAGIAAALADEPTPVASQPEQSRRTAWWPRMGRVAVAASVTLAVLIGVRMVNQDVTPGEPVIVAERNAPNMAPAPLTGRQPGGAVLAGFSQSSGVNADPQAPSAWHEQRIGNYLREHAEHSAQFTTPHLLPYARAASLEGN